MVYCSKCDKGFTVGNTNGLPNGVVAKLDDGVAIALCQECICKLGKLKAAGDKKGIEDFFKDIGIERG